MRRWFLCAAAVLIFASLAHAQLVQTVATAVNQPFGVAVDTRGNLYVADTYNERIAVLNTGSTSITVANVNVPPGQLVTVAGNGTAGFSGDGHSALAAELYNPIGVAVDSVGNIYVADLYNFRVRKIDTSGIITTIAGNGTQDYGGDNGPASGGTLYPYGIAVDGAGNVYVADTFNQRIRAINTQNTSITLAGVTIAAGNIATVAGNGLVDVGSDGPALQTAFEDPYGLTVNNAGIIYICDSYNRQIHVVNTGTTSITVAGQTIAPGNIRTVAGNGNYGYRGDGLTALSAEFADPDAVQIDAAGNIYVSDTENERIRFINNATGIVSTLIGTGVYGYNGDNIPAGTAQITYPRTIAIDGRNNVYFADEPNYRIREIQVNPGTPAIVSRPSTAFTVGAFGSFTVQTADAPTPSISFQGNLPSGINFVDNGNGTATLSGTPGGTGGSPFALTFTAMNSVGSVSQNFKLVIYSSGGGPSAIFVAKDTTTEGAWQGKYGAEGYSLANLSQKNPSYGTFGVANQFNYTWDSSPSSNRALQVPGTTNFFAATWYSNAAFTMDVNYTDGLTHLFAIYSVDWDSLNRSENIQVVDANTGGLLDSEDISNFRSGVYLVWNLRGHVQIVITPTGAANAVVSGAFFGGAGNSSSPTLVVTKSHSGIFTQGQNGATYTVNVQNAAFGTPTSGTVTVTENLPSGLSLVSMAGSQWSCSGNSCSRSDTINPGQSYSPITVTVNIASNATSPQVNQVTVSGGGSPSALALDSTLVSGNGVATFVGADITTQGNWLGQYGSDGYTEAPTSQAAPSYDTTLNTQNLTSWTWANPTTDVRALENSSGTSRTAAGWYSGSNMQFDLNITDSQTHQIAVYVVDWDNKGRTEKIQILDGSSGAPIDSRTIPDSSTSTTPANFLSGTYLVWKVSGHVIVSVSGVAGPNAIVNGIFFGSGTESVVAKSGTPQSVSINSAFAPLVASVSSAGKAVVGASVSFAAPSVGPSGTFSGSGNTASVLTDAQGNATAPTFTANGTTGGPYTVTASVAGGSSTGSFSLSNIAQVGPPASVSATAGASQSAAINSVFSTSLQTKVVDALNNPVPNVTVTFTAPSNGASGVFAGATNIATASTNTQGLATAPAFTANGQTGAYSVTASVAGISNPVGFSLTNTQAPACSGACATFIATDPSTQGNWKSKYGADGYSMTNIADSIPGYAALSSQNAVAYNWNGSTNDPRALQVPGATSGVAAGSYNTLSFSFDLNVGTSQHQVALYALDWDNRGRSETVQIFDANNSSTALDTETLSNFGNGVYAVWTIIGHVKIVVTAQSGPNAVVSGLFFGGAPTAAAVTFVGKDTATEGAWQSLYGSSGYSIANLSPQNIPAFGAFSVQNQRNYTWTGSTSDPRALQIPLSSNGIAAAWYAPFTFTLDVNAGAGVHNVALYLLDWDGQGRSESIRVLDAVTGLLLDTETIANFQQGTYLVWSVRGHIQITISNVSGPNAVVNGVFFQ